MQVPTPAVEEVVEAAEVQTGNPVVDISEGAVPTGNTNLSGVLAWSLTNLLIALTALAIAIGITIRGVVAYRRRLDEFEKKDYQRWLENQGKPEWMVQEAEEAARIEEDESKKKALLSNVLRVVSVVAGIIPLIIFFIVEDLSGTIVWINENTPVIAIIAIVFLMLAAIYVIANENKRREERRREKYNELQSSQESDAKVVITI